MFDSELAEKLKYSTGLMLRSLMAAYGSIPPCDGRSSRRL